MFDVTVDFSELAEMGANLDEKFKKLVEDAQADLGRQAYAKGVEIAKERLHSRLAMFVENWIPEDKGEEGFFLTLKGQAVWIDEGLPPNYLLPALLNSDKAKTAQDGSKYIVVPFKTQAGKGPAQLTPYQNDIAETIKQEFKQRKIPWAKIQKDDQGRPLIGTLAKIRGLRTPLKTHEGPGMGQGAIGEPRQGHTGIEFLKGANLYQQWSKDQQGQPKVERGVVTFRTASSNHPEKFNHPGLESTNILESTWEWAMSELEKEIIPKLLKQAL